MGPTQHTCFLLSLGMLLAGSGGFASVTDVARFAQEHGIFTNVDGQVTDAFDRASDKNEVQQVFRAARGVLEASAQGGNHLLVQAVELLVARLEAFAQLGVGIRVG